MFDFVNFENIILSSAHPSTPFFVGHWNPRSFSKWRGFAAEFTYNPYLRNGWVVIDTGVKGGSGTPIIEFSTWDASNLGEKITLPNTISYKFFLTDQSWKSGYLVRSAVVSNEPWSAEASRYYSPLNVYSSNTKNEDPGLLGKPKSLELSFLGFYNLLPTFFREKLTLLLRDSITSHICGTNLFKVEELLSNFRWRLKFKYNVKQFKRRFLSLLMFDRGSLSDFYRAHPDVNYLYFTRYFFSLMLKKFSNYFRFFTNSKVNRPSVTNARYSNDANFFHVLFKFNFLIFCLLENRFCVIQPLNVSVLQSLIRTAIRGIVALNFNLTATVRLDLENLLISRISVLGQISELSANNLARLLMYLTVRYVTRFKKLNLKFLGFKNQDIARHLFSKKFDYLKLGLITISQNSEFRFDRSKIFNGRNFFWNYLRAKIWRSKKNKQIIICSPKRKYNFRFKRKLKRRKFPKNAVRVFHRPWKRLVSFFRSFFMQKQFFFVSFWSLNFFNLPGGFQTVSRRSFLKAVRMIHFFRKLFKFFKFYGFYFNLVKLASRIYVSTDSLFCNLSNNLCVFLWVLHVKFWRVLQTFNSLCQKLFINRWKKLLAMSRHVSYVGRLFPKLKNHPTSKHLYRFKRKFRGFLRVASLNRRATVANALSLILSKNYLAFLKTTVGYTKRACSLNVDKRSYLQFLLLIRASSIFNKPALVKSKSDLVKNKLNSRNYVRPVTSVAALSAIWKPFRVQLAVFANYYLNMRCGSKKLAQIALLKICFTYLRLRKLTEVGKLHLFKKIRFFFIQIVNLIARFSLNPGFYALKKKRKLVRLVLKLSKKKIIVPYRGFLHKFASKYTKNLFLRDYFAKKFAFSSFNIAKTPETLFGVKRLLLISKQNARASLNHYSNKVRLNCRLTITNFRGLTLRAMRGFSFIDAFFNSASLRINSTFVEASRFLAIKRALFFEKLSVLAKIFYYANFYLLRHFKVNYKLVEFRGNRIFNYYTLINRTFKSSERPILPELTDGVAWVFNNSFNKGFSVPRLNILPSFGAQFSARLVPVVKISMLPELLLSLGLHSVLHSTYDLTGFFYSTVKTVVLGFLRTVTRLFFWGRAFSYEMFNAFSSAYFLKRYNSQKYLKTRVSSPAESNAHKFEPKSLLLPVPSIMSSPFFKFLLKEHALYSQFRNYTIGGAAHHRSELHPLTEFSFSQVLKPASELNNVLRGSSLFIRTCVVRRVEVQYLTLLSAKLNKNKTIKFRRRARLIFKKKKMLSGFTSKKLAYYRKVLRFFNRFMRKQKRRKVAEKNLVQRRTFLDYYRSKTFKKSNHIASSINVFGKKFIQNAAYLRGKPLRAWANRLNSRFKFRKFSKSLKNLYKQRKVFISFKKTFKLRDTLLSLLRGFNEPHRRALALKLYANTKARAFLHLRKGVKRVVCVSKKMLPRKILIPSQFSRKRYVKRYFGRLITFNLRRYARHGFLKSAVSRKLVLRRIRSVRRLMFEANARKSGLMPRGLKKQKFFQRRFKNRVAFKGGKKTPTAIPSLFSRHNYQSMQLLLDFPHTRFKFTRIKSMYHIKRHISRQFRGVVSLLRKFIRTCWKKRKRRYFFWRLKKTKLLRRIKRMRRFKKFGRIRYYLRRKIRRIRARTYLKVLYLVKTPKLTMSDTTVQFSNLFSEIADFRVNYSSLYSMVLRKLLYRSYKTFWSFKLSCRINFLKQTKFSFIFFFIKFFFNKVLNFFVNFTVFNKHVFSVGKDFTAFIDLFIPGALVLNVTQTPTSPALWQTVRLSDQIMPTISASLSSILVKTLYKPFNFFSLRALPATVSGFLVIADHSFLSKFQLVGSWRIWSRFIRRNTFTRNDSKLLTLRRGPQYKKPIRIARIASVHLFLKRGNFKRYFAKMKLRRFMRALYCLKTVRRKVLMDRTQLYFSRIARLRSLNPKIRFKFMLPLMRLLSVFKRKRRKFKIIRRKRRISKLMRKFKIIRRKRRISKLMRKSKIITRKRQSRFAATGLNLRGDKFKNMKRRSRSIKNIVKLKKIKRIPQTRNKINKVRIKKLYIRIRRATRKLKIFKLNDRVRKSAINRRIKSKSLNVFRTYTDYLRAGSRKFRRQRSKHSISKLGYFVNKLAGALTDKLTFIRFKRTLTKLKQKVLRKKTKRRVLQELRAGYSTFKKRRRGKFFKKFAFRKLMQRSSMKRRVIRTRTAPKLYTAFSGKKTPMLVALGFNKFRASRFSWFSKFRKSTFTSRRQVFLKSLFFKTRMPSRLILPKSRVWHKKRKFIKNFYISRRELKRRRRLFYVLKGKRKSRRRFLKRRDVKPTNRYKSKKYRGKRNNNKKPSFKTLKK